MAGENYTNTSSVATTAAPIGPSDTSVTLSSFTGYPSAPFWGELEKGTASAEIVRVTNVAGSILTITRGQDGTSATSHGAGVNFELVAPADIFNRTETHIAATTAHGVTGNVVGTSGAQTVADKLFRGGFKAQNTDSLPAGLTASFESLADDASAQDGFVHRNTAGDAARAGFLLQQSGTDRFKVRNTGTVDINPGVDANPGLRNVGTTQLDGNTTVGGTLGVTGASTLSGGATVGTGLTVSAGGATITGATAVTGTLSASGAVHAGGNLDTDGTLVVDGVSTLTGQVTASAGLTVAQNVTSWGGVVIPSVNTTSDVTSPISGMVVYDQSALAFKRRVGSVWVLEAGPLGLLARAERTTNGPSGVVTITGCLRLDGVTLRAGRRYRISAEPMVMQVTGSADTTVLTQILHNSAGTATTASPQVPGARWETTLRATTGTQNQHIYLSGSITPSLDENYSFLLAYSRTNGTGTANLLGTAASPITIYVEDLGTSPADTGVDL